MTDAVVTQAVAPAPGSPEYDAAMAAKFDSHQGTPGAPKVDTPKDDRPGWLPENFKTPEDLAKSYKEAQAELTRLKQGVKTEAPKAAPALVPKVDAEGKPVVDAEGKPVFEAPATPTVDEGRKVAESAGVDYNAAATEFATDGKLSDATYEKLAKAGIDKDLVDNYIEGRQAVQGARDAELLATVGGESQFKAMAGWAANGGMTPGEIAAFDRATVEGTKDEAALALAGLKSRYEAVKGRDPTLLTGTNGHTPSAGFRSRTEMTTAMKDPRYSSDPAYRADVEAKIISATAF